MEEKEEIFLSMSDPISCPKGQLLIFSDCIADRAKAVTAFIHG
jgi:hypothetical protein